MTTNQPKYKFVANIGDINPIEHGGVFVFVDETGVCDPLCEIVEEPQDDETKWCVYRFDLDKCTYKNGVLSDNEHHPEQKAWFSVEGVCQSNDITPERLIELLTSDNPVDRAIGYREICLYHGAHNFDPYPLRLTRKEVNDRYRELGFADDWSEET